MSNVLKMLSRGGAAAADTDPDFNQTVLLLHGDETNGAQNNTFLDSSTNNFTITKNGNTTQGTFSPFSLVAGEWSNYFDGTGDRLDVPGNIALSYSNTNTYTAEAWIYVTSLASDGSVFANWVNDTTIRSRLAVNSNGSLLYAEVTGGGTTTFTLTSSTGLVLANTWNHVALVRIGGGTSKIYLNGTEVASSSAGTYQNIPSNTFTYIGQSATTSGFQRFFNGYISNLRIVKGTAVYTAAFTPPTAPLTAISGTSLLTCQSNRFVDNSTNAFAITRNGDVRVTPFSPFAPTAAYSAGTNGGSGYFDGTGDYLSIADAAGLRFGTGNFTIQCWIYRNAAGATHTIASKGGASTGWVFQVTSGNVLRFTDTTTNIDTTTTIPALSWNHVAVIREGTGTDQVKLYINGVQSALATVSTDFNQTQQLNIGADRGNANAMNGYISGWKYVVGTAETITVPTAPPTGGTALLNFTNAGIFDNTGKNNLETVGNAQIDTTTKKYGTGSMKFDGTGDYLIQRLSNPDLTLGSGDWTIECWLYLNALPGASAFANILDQRPSSTNGVYPNIRITNSGNIEFFVSSAIQIQSNSSTINTGVWYFISISKSSGSTKMFVDGTQVGSTYTDSNNYLNSRTVIGGSAFALGAGELNGYIDDLRITKGVARYTANFTPPAQAFPDN